MAMIDKKSEFKDSWATLLKAFTRLHYFMEDTVKQQGLPGLDIYDVLWTLEQAPKHRLRFHDLAERVYISRYNITRLVQRLEKEGLLQRCACPLDKRGVYAELTQVGVKMRKKIWKIYGPLIQALYADKLTFKQHQLMVEMLKKVELPENSGASESAGP